MAAINTEQQLEIEALHAIFGDELQVVAENLYKLEIFPQQEQNQDVSINFIFELPSDYPYSPPIVKLQGSRGTLIRPYIPSLSELVREKANNLVGHAMIFELTEFLREKLDQFCNDIAVGSFSNLHNEVYFLIFNQVNPQTVGTKLPLVCKAWRQIAYDDYLWQSLCGKLYPSETIPTAKSQTSWKEEYFQLSKQMYFSLLKTGVSLFTVHRRIGTTDAWSPKSDWRKIVMKELTDRNFEFAREKILQKVNDMSSSNTESQSFLPLWEDDEDIDGEYEGILSQDNQAGYIKFYSAKSLHRLVSPSQHVQAIESLVNDCPFIGEAVGVVAFGMKTPQFETPFRMALGFSARGIRFYRDSFKHRAVRVLNLLTFSAQPIFGGKKLIGLQHWMGQLIELLEPFNEQTMARGSEYVKQIRELMKGKQTTFTLSCWGINNKGKLY